MTAMKRLLAGSMIAAALATGAAAVDTATAEAVPGNCQVVPWGFMGAGTRTLCDGPIQADGSWVRARQFWFPAYTVPLSCITNRWYSGCTGGYAVPEERSQVETYVVTPETVLPDEPGHLPAGQAI